MESFNEQRSCLARRSGNKHSMVQHLLVKRFLSSRQWRTSFRTRLTPSICWKWPKYSFLGSNRIFLVYSFYSLFLAASAFLMLSCDIHASSLVYIFLLVLIGSRFRHSVFCVHPRDVSHDLPPFLALHICSIIIFTGNIYCTTTQKTIMWMKKTNQNTELRKWKQVKQEIN